MASTSNTTMLADLFVPQVIADAVNQKLIDALRFAPLATIDNTLVGRDGDELVMPYYKYVGVASDVNEGADIPIKKLSTDDHKVKVSKIGLAVQFTDEALLIGHNNDIAEEAVKQVVTAINDKVEAKFLAEMGNATLKHTAQSGDTATDSIADALELFGEDMDGDKVVLIAPEFYTKLRKSTDWIPNTEIGADIIIRGTVGMVHGCQVAVSNRLKGSNKAYIVKTGALRLVMKRDTLVEFDRDKIDQTNFVIASKLFAPYLYDETKLIEIDTTAL